MTDTNGSKAKPDLVALRAEIQRTRADLGETVQALAARADVKARAREQVEHARQRVLTRAAAVTGRITPNHPSPVRGTATRALPGAAPVVLLAVGLAAVAGVILIVRGRR
ncbi:DUF3618 domain-containing protein [Actinoplanes sp. NPDC051851]|uniref:DUF3618 domain-containing protein n=1 Tax=Actinoplanes sp. NPDC051851 TaxID=3154753 RepID=UPI003430DC9D